MFGSYKDHGKIKKRARQVVWEWRERVMVLKKAGLTKKVTSEQRPEPGNTWRKCSRCSRQWSTVHSMCKGPEAECLRIRQEASVAGEESVRGEGRS